MAAPHRTAISAATLLTIRLNELRSMTGMSLRELQGHTHSSDSSLSRYFSGRTTPPWPVVEALCALAGLDSAKLRPLWQAATGSGAIVEAARSGQGAPVGSTPRQLPAAPRFFVGHADEGAAMFQSLAARDAAVFVIVGPGGIGKTTLALAWGHQMADAVPDGQLYVDLRGFDRDGIPARPQDVVTGFLRALGVPARRIPLAFADQTALYRSAVADKRLLVVLDNAVDSEQARGLIPGGGASTTVVTSRNNLAGLVAVEGAQPLPLSSLTDAKAFELITARLGPDRVAVEHAALELLAAACAGLSLALVILAARLKLEPDLATSGLASRLGASRDKLTESGIADGATDLRTVFSWSLHHLSPEAAELFVRLGLHPSTSISPRVALVLAAKPRSAVEAALRELTGSHLLTATPDARRPPPLPRPGPRIRGRTGGVQHLRSGPP